VTRWNFAALSGVLAGIAAAMPAHIWKEQVMLGWTLTFLVIAIIAGVLGFGGIAVASAGIAKILFVVFLVLFAVSLIAGLMRRA
jgi:uncharacterized membrane protein YtjA (UPF0391 family)